MAWVMNTSWYNSEYISFFKAIFVRNLVHQLSENQIHLYFVVLSRARHFTCVWKGSRLPSLIIRPGLSFQVVDSQRKLLEKTSSPLSGEYNHIEFECKSVSKDLLHASTYQVACGITSAHSLNSPRRLLAGSVFISFHFWKVPLKKILTLFKIIFWHTHLCFG